eukprot:TRINITY_DN11814_c0_g1_i2.p1 TRINITY_DN11814_c0_g1~~TRINITY_DN11814_c0_g1_i2.p1  ORF type:complete len:110 (-),score=8.68 TRINITY_DN11814_c0_g1_i2:1352-1681(-)
MHAFLSRNKSTCYIVCFSGSSCYSRCECCLLMQKHSSFCPWRGVGCDTNEPLVAFKGSETQSNPQLTDCWNFVNIAGGLGLALSGRAEMALIDGSLPCGHPVNRTRRSS